MNSHFSRVVGLGFLVCTSLPICAQPKAAPNSEYVSFGNKFDWSGADALAMIGAFHNKMRRARSYRGEIRTTLISAGDKKIVHTTEIQSIWIADAKKEGAASKSVDSTSSTITEPDRTLIQVSKDVNDGTKTYRLDVSGNFWEEMRWGPNHNSLPLSYVRQAWASALASVRRGAELTMERQITDGQERVLVKDGVIKQWLLDFRTGDLLFFSEVETGSARETRWLKQEFDIKLPNSAFVWKAPKGAKQIVRPNYTNGAL